MTRVHLLASEVQYERHVTAVWKHLGDLRGEMSTGPGATARGWKRDDVVMVGGFVDVDRARNQRIIYVEHGAGQSYTGAVSKHPEFYPGGEHPAAVIGYICPNPGVAASWNRPAYAAGCPALDALVAEGLAPNDRRAVLTFHQDAGAVCPEASTARPHYLSHLHEIIAWLRDHDLEPLGHWHPRDRDAPGIWKNLGIDTVANPDLALYNAGLVIADNTSLLFEAAALDIPVLVLNAPWYRRDVHHGLRFWESVPGAQFDSADELLAFDVSNYIEQDTSKTDRQCAAWEAYGGPLEPDSGERAAAWLRQLISTL